MLRVQGDAILENNGIKIKYVVQLEGAELSECEHESERRKECVTETRYRRGNSQELIYVIKLAVFLTLYG